MNHFRAICLFIIVAACSTGCATSNVELRTGVFNELMPIQTLIQEGKYNEAEGKLNHLIDHGAGLIQKLTDLEMAYALSDLAIVYYHRDQYAKSLEFYKRVLALPLEPGLSLRYDAMTSISQYYILQGRFKEAELYAKKSLAEVNDPFSLPHWTLVNIYLYKDNNKIKARAFYDEAVAAYRHASPQHRPMYLIKSWAYRQLAALYGDDAEHVNMVLDIFKNLRPDIDHRKLYKAFNVKRQTDVKVENKKDEYRPIAEVLAKYPEKESTSGITGYCMVKYTVTRSGSVKDVVTTACEPEGHFEDASIQAIKQYRYKPRVINGVAVDVKDVTMPFQFSL